MWMAMVRWIALGCVKGWCTAALHNDQGYMLVFE